MNNMISAMSLVSDSATVDLLVEGYRHIQKVEGLYGLTAREAIRTRPSRHGILNSTRYRDATPIVITGQVLGEDPDECWDQYDALAQSLAGAVDADASLEYTRGSSLALTRSCRLVDLTDPIEVAFDKLEYQLTLRPDDVRSYGAEVTVTGAAISGGGACTMSVQGTDKTAPSIRIDGAVTNPVVTLASTGESMALDVNIPLGTSYTIDMENRQLLLAGVANNVLIDYASSEFFELPTGSQTITLSGSAGTTGLIAVTYSPAYA